ncbi:hypothetical protein HRG_000083 [Hirsutella rhossiliensis]|uniref:Uncharacterized protein n=1 Tax=Hirsutella rhossiliensis TaxID=111463 RepID=A0A9P8SLZ0_9HYPO|nr:uncharacterized protein HRG_00083 [Hirsutella rhossiliensis]KAH0967441.1 hypothetical protein HRG_00083 [Hirsutella rhossiliensis]
MDVFVLGKKFHRRPRRPLLTLIDELYDFLQAFHHENGAAIVRQSSNNSPEVSGRAIPTFVVFICDRGPRRPSESTGLRRASTRKLDCQVRITASTSKHAK